MTRGYAETYYTITDIIEKYRLREPTEQWSLPSFEKLLKDVKFILSVPEFRDPNIKRWKEHKYEDMTSFEEALKEICARVLELRCQRVPEDRINETIGRQERKWGDDVMGRWALTGIALTLTQRPPRPRGRPRGTRREYPIEEWLRMRKEGMSIREIAKKTGFPKSTVHDALSASE